MTDLKPRVSDVWKPIDSAPTSGRFLVELEDGNIQVCQYRGKIKLVGSHFAFAMPKAVKWAHIP